MRFTHAPGDRPLDNYVIKHALGRGGFGEVYHAISDAGKEVALKLVQRNLEVELRGVSNCLNLKHPNLVGLYDVKQSENGDHWIVMEYVNGDGLDRVIAKNKVGLEPEQVLSWLRGLGDGVNHLHECGIVHRDLKPGNIFLENGVVKIGDYGLAKFISASRRSGQTGSVGTVHYMAPEVVNGRYGKEVDLYAVGVILYEMLTGKVPFDGECPGEILMKHLTVAPDLTPLPPAYRAVVARLLAKDPFQRYSSFKAMLADLDGYLATPPEAWITTTPPLAMPAPITPMPTLTGHPALAPQLASPPESLGFVWYFAAALTCIATAVTAGIVGGVSMEAVTSSILGDKRSGPGGAVGIAMGIFSALLTLGLMIFLFQRWAKELRSGTLRYSPTLSGRALPFPVKILIAMGTGAGSCLLISGATFGGLGGAGVALGMGIGFLMFGIVAFLLFRLPTEQPFPPHAGETPAHGATLSGQEARQTGPWQSVR